MKRCRQTKPILEVGTKVIILRKGVELGKFTIKRVDRDTMGIEFFEDIPESLKIGDYMMIAPEDPFDGNLNPSVI